MKHVANHQPVLISMIAVLCVAFAIVSRRTPRTNPMTSHKFHTQHWHLHDISRFVFVNLHFLSVILHSYQSLPANHGQTTFSDAGSFIFPKTMKQLIPKHPQFHPLFGRWFRWLSYLFKGDLFGDLHILRSKVLNSGISWAQDATDSFERHSDARKFRFPTDLH